jgi:hypothetical protein
MMPVAAAVRRRNAGGEPGKSSVAYGPLIVRRFTGISG